MHVVVRLVGQATRSGDDGDRPNIPEALVASVAETNLDRAVTAAVQSMDAHLAVAPLQWICLVCLSELHALNGRMSDVFIAQNGCHLLHR